MNSALVSVVIPAYKSTYLIKTVESVLAQSYAAWEVIVVNDGSPYQIRKLLESFIDSRRITYIEQENRGTAAARNRGLAEATGEFIAFLDDDDFWPPDKLEWQAQYLTEHPDAGVVVGGCIAYVDESGKVVKQHSLDDRLLSFEDFFTSSYIRSPGQAPLMTRSTPRVCCWQAIDTPLLRTLTLSIDRFTRSA